MRQKRKEQLKWVPLWLQIVLPLISLLIFPLFIFIPLLYHYKNKYVRDINQKTNKHKQWLITLNINELKIYKYCFIKHGVLDEKFSKEQLQENKFEKRPWICFKSKQLSKHGAVIIVPQKTNHKKDKTYCNNVYLNDNKFYLDVEQFYVIDKLCLKFINKNWRKSNNSPVIEDY